MWRALCDQRWHMSNRALDELARRIAESAARVTHFKQLEAKIAFM